MALHEEHNTAHNKTLWRSHFEQERRQLSASVEETLTNSSSQGEQWDEEPHSTSRKTALIPPRLSLQSKMLPAVQREGGLQSTTGIQPVARPQKEAAPSQNVFKRFIQHLTSPFTTPSAAISDEALTASPDLGYPQSQTTAVLPEVHSLSQPTGLYERKSSSPAPTVIDAVPSARPPILPEVYQSGDTGKQRLAGRNAKVRLETTPLPSVKPATSSDAVNKQASVTQPHNDDAFGIREPINVLVRTLPTDKAASGDTAIVGRDAISSKHKESTDTSSFVYEQDTPRVSTRKIAMDSDERRLLSGSAMFENGQCDYMVKNTHITSASVVQVMLTANPGPVAIHYVTLQPQVGFTVHLTGPTTVKTPFNYVIV